MKTALVVLNYKEAENTINVIKTAQNIPEITDIVIVDNQSNDGSCDIIEPLCNEHTVLLRADENKGYTVGYNIGLRYILDYLQPDLIFVVNADIIYDRDLILASINAHQEHDDYGLITAKMLDYFRKEQNSVWHFPKYKQYLDYCFYFSRKKKGLNRTYGELDTSTPLFEVDVVRGSFQSIKAEALRKTGLYDENIFLFNFENIISKKMYANNYKVGILTGYTYIHNHKPGTVNVLFRMKYCLQENYYYMSKYEGINFFQKAVLKLAGYYGYFEQSLIEKISVTRHKGNR